MTEMQARWLPFFWGKTEDAGLEREEQDARGVQRFDEAVSFITRWADEHLLRSGGTSAADLWRAFIRSYTPLVGAGITLKLFIEVLVELGYPTYRLRSGRLMVEGSHHG